MVGDTTVMGSSGTVILQAGEETAYSLTAKSAQLTVGAKTLETLLLQNDAAVTLAQDTTINQLTVESGKLILGTNKLVTNPITVGQNTTATLDTNKVIHLAGTLTVQSNRVTE